MRTFGVLILNAITAQKELSPALKVIALYYKEYLQRKLTKDESDNRVAVRDTARRLGGFFQQRAANQI